MKTLDSIPLQALSVTNATAQYNIGDTYQDEKGYMWVYTQAGEALTAGSILTVNHELINSRVNRLAVATTHYASTIYAEEAVITVPSTPWTINEHIGAMGVVSKGGTGETFVVRVNSDGGLFLEEPLVSDTPLWVKGFNPNIAIETPSGMPRVPVGIAPVTVAASSYFWRQVSGYASLVTDNAQEGAEGRPVVTGGGVAGQGLVLSTFNANDFRAVVGHIVIGSEKTNSSCWVKLVSML